MKNLILKHKNIIIFLAFSIAITAISYDKLSLWLSLDYNLILLALAIPFAAKTKGSQKSVRFGLLAVALMLLYPVLKLSSIYFFAFACSVLFFYEGLVRKLNLIPFILIIIASPVAGTLIELIGFEIRMYLTQFAGNILSFLDSSYSSSGNIIMIGNEEFHVDPECMGLKMVVLGFFSTLVMIVQTEKKVAKVFSWYQYLILFFISGLCIILANLFRIIGLTLLKSYPDTLSHEIIGVVTFVIYVLVPIYFLLKLFSRKMRIAKSDSKRNNLKPWIVWAIISLLIGLAILFRISPVKKNETKFVRPAELNFDIGEYNYSIENLNVVKLVNEDMMIYVKPPSNFYAPDHSPILCWRGCGYKISHEKEVEINGTKVYYSQLELEKDKLHTIWWYDSDMTKTSSQVKWRLETVLYGKDFHLINVVSEDKNLLFEKAEELLGIDVIR